MKALTKAKKDWAFICETDEAIEALVALRDFREHLKGVEDELAREARTEGATWQVIGDMLGISRQAAYERYADASTDERLRYERSLANIDPDIKARTARIRATH